MIGNDVIDLALAKNESNWKRPGFVQKLFTENEQKLIENASDRELMVWNLWSRKEAAYKIYNRQTHIRAFMPLQLECTFENVCDGKVRIGRWIYFTKTILCNVKIHTIAVNEPADFSKILKLEDDRDVLKTDGIPYLNHSKNPVSKSHHGRFEEIVVLNL